MKNSLLLLFVLCSLHQALAQPTVDGNLSDPQYAAGILATKGNSNACFGGGKDVTIVVYYPDAVNQFLYVGIVGKLVSGSSDGIGLWLNFSNLSGAAAGTNLGNSTGGSGGHYMGDPSNPNFRADFEVDYMFAMNPGSGGDPMFVDVVKKVGGTSSSYLGNCGQAGVAITGPSANGVFAANSVSFAFDNSGSPNRGFEIKIPFSQLGVTPSTTIQAFAFIVSATAFFSDITVPGDVPNPPNCLGINPNFNTLSGGFYHSTGSNPLPVQLVSFSGTRLSSSSVRLDWRTISEINNYGFVVERRNIGTDMWNELAGSFISGHGTTNQPQSYTFTDGQASSSSLQYRLRQIDLGGEIHYSEPILINSPTSVDEDAPKQFSLYQNYPNPFNPSTEIKFSVAKSGSAKLTVFNQLGQQVATLFDAEAEAGKFYRVAFKGENLSSGTYFYRLQSENRIEMRKLVLLK